MKQVSIFEEGGPTQTCTLAEFFAVNEFTSEELAELFAAFAAGKGAVIGGGAAAMFLVRLYQPGDELSDCPTCLQPRDGPRRHCVECSPDTPQESADPADSGADAVRQTSCTHCGQDIEGVWPYRAGEWRDRGNNTHCPTPEGKAGRLHAPCRAERSTWRRTPR